MLEDDFTYVLRKALARAGLAPSEAAARAGLPETQVMSFLRGIFHEEAARKLAAVLGLNAEAFSRHADYQPAVRQIPGITRLDLSFDDDRVNAWVVEINGRTLLFDLGTESHEVFAKLAGKQPDAVFLTHGHRDHIGGLKRALASGVPVHSADQPGTRLIIPGDETHGVKAVRLDGHYTPALGYFGASAK